MANMPTIEVVVRDGEPIWRVCAAGYCVEDRSGVRARELLDALCVSRGIEPPRRGPCEVDEPGV